MAESNEFGTPNPPTECSECGEGPVVSTTYHYEPGNHIPATVTGLCEKHWLPTARAYEHGYEEGFQDGRAAVNG